MNQVWAFAGSSVGSIQTEYNVMYNYGTANLLKGSSTSPTATLGAYLYGGGMETNFDLSKWTFSMQDDGTYVIQNVGNGYYLCLDGTANGVKFCTSVSTPPLNSQRWYITSTTVLPQ
eukprot:Phypoly_transcript_22355.p1 GENE.Phypoly_transcript_22355~~Phypoly_transcript_22355.p1  ORF type:complete len:117 (-),score=23.28 Phypoly_transcript_22355:181-531(-)